MLASDVTYRQGHRATLQSFWPIKERAEHLIRLA
jgi:hypothetical protein